jgi:hypothetical protein
MELQVVVHDFDRRSAFDGSSNDCFMRLFALLQPCLVENLHQASGCHPPTMGLRVCVLKDS